MIDGFRPGSTYTELNSLPDGLCFQVVHSEHGPLAVLEQRLNFRLKESSDTIRTELYILHVVLLHHFCRDNGPVSVVADVVSHEAGVLVSVNVCRIGYPVRKASLCFESARHQPGKERSLIKFHYILSAGLSLMEASKTLKRRKLKIVDCFFGVKWYVDTWCTSWPQIELSPFEIEQNFLRNQWTMPSIEIRH